VASERLPAYSGATVPAFDRLPARKREQRQILHAGRCSWFPVQVGAVSRFLALSIVAALSACAPGAAVRAKGAAPRIVSLMPSLTQDLCAVGAGRQIAAVSKFSRDIPCARGLPRVADSFGIDAEAIVALHPQVVVGIPSQRLSAEPLRRAGISTFLFADDSYASIFQNIRALAALSGHAARGRAVVAQLQKETACLRSSERFRRRPSVFFVEQAEPIWTVGPQSYIAALIALAGGRNAVRSLPSAYALYSDEALVALQPDVLVADRDAHLADALGREPWRSLRAVREHHVYTPRDASLLDRPGPRYNEGLFWLIEHLRPLAIRASSGPSSQRSTPKIPSGPSSRSCLNLKPLPPPRARRSSTG
jgi:ABC-type Fe3+-hydroxamate transport system substrate-binding protein